MSELPEIDALKSHVESLRLSRDVMELMLRGKSAIDSREALPIRSVNDADNFLLSYGYNSENVVERAEIQGNYHEALRFIKKYFLRPENPDGAALEIPRNFFELSDVRELFVWASDKGAIDMERTQWACAILRVMHTISHLDKDLRHEYFPTIQQQVFDRFYKEIHSFEGKIFLGDPKSRSSVELAKFQTKPRKGRDSLVLKLLHKSENVAEEVFDQVGVRFVTKKLMDTVKVLKYLQERYIVMPMNIRPSRSRNNLIDPLLYRRTWREARSIARSGGAKALIDGMIEDVLKKGYEPKRHHNKSTVNPFTSANYRSIQFTCRQLIKYRNPIYEDIKQLRTALKKIQDPEIMGIMERLDIAHLSREQRFFYPFEVQILDLHNHEEAENGRASHAVYKKAQLKAAMERVLGRLLEPPMSQS